MLLENKVAIVTGGGGAIGRAICMKLAEEGAKVAVFDLFEEGAAKIADEINNTTSIGEARAYAVNVGDYEMVAESVEKVYKHFGSIDILVNSAGGSAREKMTEFYKQSIDVIHEMLQVNLMGALYCTRAVSPYMVEAKHGRIVNITSIVAKGGLQKCAEYGAAKGGILSAMKSLAIELGPYNITVNCVSPGRVERDKVENEQDFAHRYSVMNRVCTQNDIAHAVLFMVHPESDYITGQELVVDGGRSLGLKGSI